MTHSVTLTIPVTSTSTLGKIRNENGFKNAFQPSRKTGPQTENVRDSSQSTTVVFVVVIFIWYSVSVGHNMLNKRLLEPDLFPYPFTLTLIQLSFITMYSHLYLQYFAKDDKHVLVSIGEVIKTRRHRRLIILLSLGKFLTLVFSHLSLSRVPLAFTHTGNLFIFFAVFFTLPFVVKCQSNCTIINTYLQLKEVYLFLWLHCQGYFSTRNTQSLFTCHFYLL